MAERLEISRPVPQEIFLLERYTSKAYFSAMRDDWERMIQHVEGCLAAFTNTLPPDYRSRPLPEQPDIIWGERVLPNFRDTREALNRAYISLTHGDLQALGHAGRVTSDFAGFSRDYSSDWMDEPQIAAEVEGGGARFWHWLTQAVEKATNIETTLRAHWVEGDLTSRYDEARGALNPPQEWPRYSIDPRIRTATGEPAPATGVYLPQVANSCAAFILKDESTPPASVGYDPDTFQNRLEAACSWQLVVRGEGEWVADGLVDLRPSGLELRPGRSQAGDGCPRAGWWYTSARAGSRRYFKQDDIFPSIEGSDYGQTFWLWSDDQTAPRLR